MRTGFLALVLVSFGVAVGVAGPLWFSDRRVSRRPSPAVVESESESGGAEGLVDVVDPTQLDEIFAALEDERVARRNLAAEVESLKNQLARLQSARLAQTDSAPAQRTKNSDAKQAPARPRALDVDALVSAGFSEQTVRDYKDRVDQMELDRLYLRDIATREGWLNTHRFREETEALQLDAGSTREDYGEDFYDWMLYTTGQPNRVSVQDVMSGSAAEDIGLRPGDVVVAYDDARIFSPRELRDATIAGDPGAPTEVEVIRNGRLTRLTVPRGPLGIRVEHANVEPRRPS